ncbi:MAG: TraB/GumN family protein [Paludibacteraceae bacterium]|nr:TraB/GumN family protein [Paludibacteraceae bacterium]
MKKTCLTILFSFTMLTVAWGQVLYEISGNGLKNKSYIFGECKWVPTSFLDSVPELIKAYGHCEQIAVECFMNNVDVADDLRRAALLPDSAKYEDMLSHDEYQIVNQALLNRLHLGLEQLGRMNPAAISDLFLSALYKEELGYDEQRSMENFFTFIAIEQGHDIISLDDTQQTIQQLFHREPLYYQVKELYNMVVYNEREVETVKSLISAYRKGELAYMSYIIRGPENKSSMSFSDYQAWSSRWTRWVKTLGEILGQRSTFVVLDARYLGSDKGFLQALRAAGYKVKAVKVIKPAARI